MKFNSMKATGQVFSCVISDVFKNTFLENRSNLLLLYFSYFSVNQLHETSSDFHPQYFVFFRFFFFDSRKSVSLHSSLLTTWFDHKGTFFVFKYLDDTYFLAKKFIAKIFSKYFVSCSILSKSYQGFYFYCDLYLRKLRSRFFEFYKRTCCQVVLHHYFFCQKLLEQLYQQHQIELV